MNYATMKLSLILLLFCFLDPVLPFLLHQKNSPQGARNNNLSVCKRVGVTRLQARISDTSTDKNLLYQWLSTPTPPGESEAAAPEKSNSMFFFYNDEVMSHLHGYMLLVGTLALQGKTFLYAFIVYAIAAAAATYFEYLPANPRVPAIVAVATLATCVATQAVVPSADDSAWIVGVCAVNIVWGFWGPWQSSLQQK